MNVDSSCSTPTHVTTASQSPVSISSPSRVEFIRRHRSAVSIWSTQQRCGTGVASPSSVDPTDVCRGRVSSVTPADRDRSLGVTTNAKPGTSMRSRHSLPMPSIISRRNLEWECLQSLFVQSLRSCPWLFLAVCGASPTLRFLLELERETGSSLRDKRWACGDSVYCRWPARHVVAPGVGRDRKGGNAGRPTSRTGVLPTRAALIAEPRVAGRGLPLAMHAVTTRRID